MSALVMSRDRDPRKLFPVHPDRPGWFNNKIRLWFADSHDLFLIVRPISHFKNGIPATSSPATIKQLPAPSQIFDPDDALVSRNAIWCSSGL